MPPESDYRRRRIAFGMAAVALLAITNLRSGPAFSTLSIYFDGPRAPGVEVQLAPPFDLAAAGVALLLRQLTH